MKGCGRSRLDQWTIVIGKLINRTVAAYSLAGNATRDVTRLLVLVTEEAV